MGSNVVFVGFVDDAGHFALDNATAFREYVQQFKGEEVEVTVERKRRQRSSAQNRFLWGACLPAIAEHCGYDHHEMERLHYDLLSVRFGTTAIAPLMDGAPPRIVPTRTSSELNTAEFSDYLEWLVRFAAEKFGVVISFPDELRQPERKSA